MFALISVMASASPAQTFTTLASFNETNGDSPLFGPLAQGTDGNFYGTTEVGGGYQAGTVFKITAAGALTTVYSFTGAADGAAPFGGLVLAGDGNFYGTTVQGGADQSGTVFKITPAGILTTLYSFTGGADGNGPAAGLLLGASGSFYGTTQEGGANGDGTIFEITPAGDLTTLYSFTGGADGGTPNAALVQSINGDLFGTATLGGSASAGTAYKITLSGEFTTLYGFSGSDGTFPTAPLALGVNQEFYGTATQGGSGFGTLFKISPRGSLAVLHTFSGGADEGDPTAGLLQANDGNLYGTASANDFASDFGTIFKITPKGALTTLHTFGGTDGAYPYAGLLQATDGKLYGTTGFGGDHSYGTVFSLSMGLPPLVKAVPRSGKVGSNVIILGNNLTGATKVNFNGTPAAFTVISPTEITTTVPAGAISGPLAVTTPGGVVPGVFLVPPVISSFSPASGPAGTVVTIMGEALTGATGVTFDGVPATSFTVNSYAEITVTVPSGAQTGTIDVITPSGVAGSAGTFTVN